MNSKKRQRSIVDLLRAYHRLDQMIKSLRSRSLQCLNNNHPKEETKKRRFVGPDYVPPKTRDCPRNNHLINSFLHKTTRVEACLVDKVDNTTVNELLTITEVKNDWSETSHMVDLKQHMSQVTLQVSEIPKPMNDFTHLRDELNTPETIVRKRNYNQMIVDNYDNFLSPENEILNTSIKRNKIIESEEHCIDLSSFKTKGNVDDSDSESIVTMCRHIVEERERAKQEQHAINK